MLDPIQGPCFGLARIPWVTLGLAAIVLGIGCKKAPPSTSAASELRGQPMNPSPTQAPASVPATGAVQTLTTAESQSTTIAYGQPTSSSVSNPQLSASSDPAGTPLASVAEGGSDYLRVGFDKLSGYDIQITDEIISPQTNSAATAKASASDQIPKAIKDLNAKPVAVKGFMLPLKVEGGLVTELLVMKDQSMCCYGVTPRINEWISVTMAEKGVKPIMDQPVTLFGRLKVGEMRENGYLVGIYAMEGHSMAGPLDE